MKVLSEEKSKLAAERNGWSLAYAEGHVEGETMRRSGKVLSMYALVGIDDYARGFRAGYFPRRSPNLNFSAAPRSSGWTPMSVQGSHIEVAKEPTDFLQNVAR